MQFGEHQTLKTQSGFCIRSSMKKSTVLKIIKAITLFLVGFAIVFFLCFAENPSGEKQPMLWEAFICATMALICTYLPDIIKKIKNRKK